MFAITLKFLEAVQKNNNTEWFHANYDLYQQEKKRFGKLISALIAYGQQLNPNRSDLQLKNCIFRFNRDIRYRADKSPYKDHFGAELALGGKRSGRPCFYFELRPGGSFVGVGSFRAGQPFEHQMRRHAILNFEQRKQLQEHQAFSSFFGPIARADQPGNEFIGEYKSMYCLKKAFPDIENLPNKLSAQRTKLRTTKCTYQRAKAIIETFPPQDQEYYYQLCFLKDRLWQVQIPEEDLLSDKLLDQLKKALELAMPMIRFLEEGIGY